MIFFRKKKPASPPPAPAKSEAAPKKKEAPSPLHKSLQEIAHDRILTAEGWKRLMRKKLTTKKK